MVPFQAIEQASEKSKAVKQALWWDLLFAIRIEREHIVSLGRRTAVERLGHLLCELHLRLTMTGPNTLHFKMPLTQTVISDVLGLTPVHVNRSLQELRSAGLITLKDRKLHIHDLETLRERSYFEYLEPAICTQAALEARSKGHVNELTIA
jgi:CRP-like cAMP-binding protein